jgi:hypothetical protein
VGPPPSHIIATEIDDDLSLYDARAERVVVLNATASDIWRLADGEHTVDDIVDLLAGAYSIAAEDIRADVEQAITSLVDDGVLTRP